ncbi:MAG: adenosylmethionine--8-amino-7-oxononanoate transaminase [Sedimentisphaerales bacterium]|nr:adenosylmethionine--8-amino-7-oxononanoate transaminase [Sedimentisphaerales bacterium]
MTAMETREYQEWDKKYIWHPFTPMRLWLNDEPLVIERGVGAYLYDTDGHRYLDGVSSLWCNIHGHNHPHINAAIISQMQKIAHSTMLGLAGEMPARLAKELVDITPGNLTRVFYSDSGATSVEIAIKMAFQYWLNLGHKDRHLFIALKQSYHGDTMGSVSVGGIDIFHRIFGPLTFKAQFAPSPHPYRFAGTEQECRQHALDEIESLLQQYKDQVAAIVMEPLVQGAAGIIVHPEGFLRSVAGLARRYGVLLVADEVATGFGRTGTMFACEQEQAEPDIICLAKGLTGGYVPLAATLTSEQVFEVFLHEPWTETTFYHGHTYTGNAIGCAAALASLEVFEREETLAKLPGKIALIQEYLQNISKLEFVGDVRQKGMMAGVELLEDKPAKKNFDTTRRIGTTLCRRMRDKGVILRPLSDVLVIMPPLAISMNDLEFLLSIIEETIKVDLRKIV